MLRVRALLAAAQSSSSSRTIPSGGVSARSVSALVMAGIGLGLTSALLSASTSASASYASQAAKPPSSSSPSYKSFSQDFVSEVRSVERGGVSVRGGVWQIPHDSKRSKGGEDTYVLSADLRAFAVFDGVGGWAESGVDPRDYSLALASATAAAAEATSGELDPVRVLSQAYATVSSARVIGSTTATVATLSDDGRLRIASLGDSGAMVVRDGRLVLRSAEQQHVFNMPYQLGTQSGDRPEHARRYETQLSAGDTVLLATDGVLDNLDDAAILKALAAQRRAQPQTEARAVCEAAYVVSKDERANTPFAQHARQQLGAHWPGGKADDITVLVVHYGHHDAAKL